ncbi:hypothetical protein J6590_100115, partial [Homalodisca vitripennis]
MFVLGGNRPKRGVDLASETLFCYLFIIKVKRSPDNIREADLPPPPRAVSRHGERQIERGEGIQGDSSKLCLSVTQGGKM